jgi:chorismate dehydratase
MFYRVSDTKGKGLEVQVSRTSPLSSRHHAQLNRAPLSCLRSKWSSRSKPCKPFKVSACLHVSPRLPVYFGFHERTINLPKLRISIVQYLNTAPLVWGFTNGPLRGKYDLSFTVPSLCAEALRSGEADIAIIPAIEYQRISNLAVLPDLAIASKNRVRSLLIIAKKPISQVRSIALDRGSRSTQALTRILCAEHWKITPTFFEAPPNLNDMLEEADAALLIGDPALQLSVAIEDAATIGPLGDLVCKGSKAGIRDADALYVYDIVEQWRKMTALPAVLAIWAARRDAATPEVIADFAASRKHGLARIAEISKAAAPQLNLLPAVLASYLSWNIDYSLDAENRQGLELYYQRAAHLGLIPQAKPIDWAFDASSIKRAGARS